jgi:hypothetical protein
MIPGIQFNQHKIYEKEGTKIGGGDVKTQLLFFDTIRKGKSNLLMKSKLS